MDRNVRPTGIVAMFGIALCMGGCLEPMGHDDIYTKARKGSPSTLKRLANHEDPHVRTLVAQNPQTPVATLEKLLHDSSRGVQINALKNSSLPLESMAQMASDAELRSHIVEKARYPSQDEVPLYVNSQYDVIRESVAQSPTLEDAWYEKLSHDSNVRVRCYVASNQGCSPEILIRMMDDSNPYVKVNLLHNPFMPQDKKNEIIRQADLETRELIAKNVRFGYGWEKDLELESHESLRLAYAQNPYITTNALDQLAQDSSAAVRLLVVKNEKTTNATLEKLVEDPDPEVRSAVMQTLGNRHLAELERLTQQMAEKQRQEQEQINQFKTLCLHPRIAPMLREKFSIRSEADIDRVLKDETKLREIMQAIQQLSASLQK